MSTTTVEDIYELSPLQRGMLLHAVHDGASDMYLGQHVYVVDGHLDVDALIRAWRLVFESHPALRTSFHWDGLDKPLQVVHRDVTPPAHRDDWSDLAEDRQRERLDLLMAEDRATGFDLTSAPLQRLHLIRLGDDRHALAWTHHHLLLDGWSVPIFMNEVMAHYESLMAGGPLPPPAPPFRDYIAWLQRQDLDGARNFWKETLAGVTPSQLVALQPLDPRRGTGVVDRHIMKLPGTTEDGLRDAAARHQVTLNTVLHAAWAVVLSRYTGRRDVVFGCVSSGRPAELPDVDRMIGMFVNTLPVPVTVPQDGDVGQWLRAIQSMHAAIRRYEFSPLSDIKRWAGAPGQQLFDSLFVLDNYAFGVEAGSSSAGRLTVRSQTSYDKISVPLSVIVTPAPVSEVHMVMHRNRFGPGFADSLFDCLLTTLDAITRADSVRLVATAAGPLPETAHDSGRDRTATEDRSGPPVAPATPEEEAIAAVYREILERTDIDVTTSFFDLGGDSFGAVRAVSRIEGATVAMLALNPSVRDLVAALATDGPMDGGGELDAEIAELERQLAETDDLKRRLTEFYTLDEEDERVANSGHGRLEFERTKEIILRHLPPPPAVIADIGGGTGRYALWLAELGYRVVHRDIVPAFVERLRAAAGPDAAVDTEVGDARSLDVADESVDAVLLLGPLYHLPRQADRVLALRQARRIVKSGGVVFVAALSRWAARLDGVLRERMYERGEGMLDLIDSVERTGVLPSLARTGYTAYTHRPRDLQAEFRVAGLDVADLVSVEGAAYLLSVGDLTDRMDDPQARRAILESARAHERVPELLGLGPHLVATGVRP